MWLMTKHLLTFTAGRGRIQDAICSHKNTLRNMNSGSVIESRLVHRTAGIRTLNCCVFSERKISTFDFCNTEKQGILTNQLDIIWSNHFIHYTNCILNRPNRYSLRVLGGSIHRPTMSKRFIFFFPMLETNIFRT